jgi:NitT/TauT family transport system substrate-binding protein
MLGLLVAALAVSVGGPADDPAFLPVHAAAALGTFEAEGVQVELRRAKHPAGAVEALRNGEAAVAVTTADQAVRGGWARGTPVRVLVAHTRTADVALLVSPQSQDVIHTIGDLRRRRVGLPAPGTSGHLLLSTLLRRHRLSPADLELVSLGGSALVTRLAAGDVAAAILDEPWISRALALGAGQILVDFRSPNEAARQLGGAFHEIVTVARADEKKLAEIEVDLAGYVRALIRVQAWLAATPAASVAERLPDRLVGRRESFVARLEAARAAYQPDGEATEAGLRTTLDVLRAGTPLPVTLKIGPAELREPAFVSAARAALGRRRLRRRPSKGAMPPLKNPGKGLRRRFDGSIGRPSAFEARRRSGALDHPVRLVG